LAGDRSLTSLCYGVRIRRAALDFTAKARGYCGVGGRDRAMGYFIRRWEVNPVPRWPRGGPIRGGRRGGGAEVVSELAANR
jgi:hypothetical protein